MTAKRPSKIFRPRTRSNVTTTLGFIAVMLFFVASGAISYWNIQILDRDSLQVVRTHKVITALDDLLSIMKDAETGQRGYLITGDEKYLEPYRGALTNLDERINALEDLTEKNSTEQNRLPDMKQHIHAKMKELAQTILLRHTRGFDAARGVVVTDLGKIEMDDLRDEIGRTQTEEDALRDRRLVEMSNAYEIAIVSGLLTGLFGLLLSASVAYLVTRAAEFRRRQEWLQTGQVGLGIAMVGEQRVDRLAKNILTFLAEYLDAHVGAFFAGDGGEFVRIAEYGLPANSAIPDRLRMGEGLLGQAARDKKTFLVEDVPEGYLSVGSALGRSDPRYLIVSPATADDEVNAVYELGFIHKLDRLTLEFLELATGSIGVAVRSAIDRTKLQDLLEETQRQGEELQTQSEELRVSNEELEEQSRALKESQARLEDQQSALEETNAQLEAQTNVLEDQRDVLSRTKQDLEVQAKDLERTSRFKSDFLANMSHELRTPLNSSLILAKLLGDNREGNLSEEQVRYAQTIQAAGNDLLALIGDILDLSKIEAGHMEVQVETWRVEEIVAELRRGFDPVAKDKTLDFNTEIDADTPEIIETDGQRLHQILRNLLSNAMKFTERGEVKLQVARESDGSIAFKVSDTGIGISSQQREMVFEAFRQADGTTNRKYGGTGLGLSISRELAHLLGGEITLESEQGKGSTFTVTLPEKLILGQGSSPDVERAAPPAPIYQENPKPAKVQVAQVPDDRNNLSNNGRTILVIEDDERFARILYDLAHEHDFQCLIATSADAGLSLASEYLPSAVILDIGLPDNSGLSVLDRLKQEGRTRHIPAHVVSGGDYSRTAMALGAIGYMLKPVMREELSQAFENLEARLTQRLRRVLVVEDDAVQLESLRLLLNSRHVETVGADSAAKCLEALRSTVFDCIVLDLSLPDAAGFSLLEMLSNEHGHSYPPVIVYTGRELTSVEEQRLRKYSHSIIVKGVKSPERLLDEVALFLHQVVAELPLEKRRLIEKAKNRDAALEDRLILVVEDDARNIFALTSILEPRGAKVEIARNGREALEVLDRLSTGSGRPVDLVLMDIMMPEMDGFTAMREIRKRPEWRKLPIIALTAKAMKNDQEQCLEAGANDYVAKPLDVEKLLSLIRVWMPRD